MALPEAYLVTTKNLDAIFNAIQGAQAPERFSQKFLEHLGFTSSNDRLYIRLLKELGFLDDSGVPTQMYYDFLDQTQAKAVLAKAITEAYSDLFMINKNAWKMTEEEVQNKLKTLTQGKKSENVIRWMARTFKDLCEYADWQGLKKLEEQKKGTGEIEEGKKEADNKEENVGKGSITRTQLHYNIQIHLPESRDPKVYDAIFESLKRHLM